MVDPSGLGKYLLAAGLLLAAIGSVLIIFGKIPFFGQLSGDIKIQGENYTFYFPVVTCIVLSIVLSIIVWIITKMR